LTMTDCAARGKSGASSSQQKIRAFVTFLFYRGTDF
jgi:hypothetical protein